MFKAGAGTEALPGNEASERKSASPKMVSHDAAELVVGLTACFAAGQRILLRPGEADEETVEIFDCVLRRAGVSLLLVRGVERAHPLGATVVLPSSVPRSVCTAPSAASEAGLGRVTPHDGDGLP